MVSESKRVSGRKIILALAAAVLLFGVFVIDRVIYFRKKSWSAATVKGIGAVYFGCEKPVEIKEAVTGDWLFQTCKPELAEEFAHKAKEISVFPGGCFYKSVLAWGPELHYWAEEWMPFAPKAGRYVLFDDKRIKFVPADEFSSFGCP